jgi:hypothetical protein
MEGAHLKGLNVDGRMIKLVVKNIGWQSVDWISVA